MESLLRSLSDTGRCHLLALNCFLSQVNSLLRGTFLASRHALNAIISPNSDILRLLNLRCVKWKARTNKCVCDTIREKGAAGELLARYSNSRRNFVQRPKRILRLRESESRFLIIANKLHAFENKRSSLNAIPSTNRIEKVWKYQTSKERERLLRVAVDETNNCGRQMKWHINSNIKQRKQVCRALIFAEARCVSERMLASMA